jgi:tetratricopeptide (TPR) repeat protein
MLVLAALLPLTVWQTVHSEAIVEARAAYNGRAAPLHLHSLWASARQAWDGGRPTADPAGKGRPDYRLALRRALDQLDQLPGDAEAARLAALSLSKLDYAVRAEPYFQLAREGGTLSPDDLHARALGLARGNQRDLAITAYQEILAVRPEDADALQRLAALYYSKSRLNEALETAERLAKIPGSAVAGYALIGIVHHDEHRLEQAVAAGERVLDLNPDLSELSLPPSLFYSDLAQDLIDLGRPADARRHLQRALSRSDDPVLINLLGVTHKREGNGAEAALCWKRATEADPKLAGPWLNLGLQALEEDRVADAVSSLEKANALDRDSLEPTYQLSLAYRRAGRERDAERFRKRADEIRRKLAADSRPRRSSQAASP